jgi:phosphatidyl-N-methylethanolamine N-methyltransferase
MTGWMFVGAAILLSVERIAYVLIWHNPGRFRTWCGSSFVRRVGDPVDVVRLLFLVCKVIQAVVFAAWIYAHSGDRVQLLGGDFAAAALGVGFILVGQALNLSVFHKLGSIGVFYGTRFGHDLPWCRTFPFSFLAHPQYVGTVLSIWGLFLITRFPNTDWYLLPTLETAYYGFGARFEQ